MKKHVTLRIFGRVQGVCFRSEARKTAMKLGLTGFVKNMHDDSVYMEAEGEKQDLEVLVEWAHRGPPAAKVTKVMVDYSEVLTKVPDFEIRYW